MSFDSPSTLVCATALLVVFAAHRLRGHGRPSRRNLGMLGWLGLLCLALGDPQLSGRGAPGGVVLLIDDSASTGERAEQVAERLRQRLGESTALVRSGGTSDLGGLLARGAARLGTAGGALVLISDGLDRGHSLDDALGSLAVRGVRVEAVSVAGPEPAARMVSVRSPERIEAGKRLPLAVGLAGGPGEVQLRASFGGGPAVTSPPVTLASGDTVTAVEVVMVAPVVAGGHGPVVEVLPADGRTRVLTGIARLHLLVGEQAPIGLLGDATLPADWPSEVAPVQRLEARPFAPGELVAYQAIVAGGVIAPEVARSLAEAVRRGETGLVLQGGPASFGAGGWQRTALGELSPLDPEPRDRRPARVVVLADRSGSMKQERVLATRAAIARLHAALAVGDALAVVPYADGPLPGADELRLQPLPAAADRAQLLAELLAGYPPGEGRGRTALAPAVRQGLELLAPPGDEDTLAGAALIEGQPQPLLLVITDAELRPEDLSQTCTELAARAPGIELVMLVTSSAGMETLAQALAAAGVDASLRSAAGETAAAAELGQLLTEVFQEATQDRWVEAAPAPVLSASGTTLGRVGALDRTKPRPEAPPLASAGELPVHAEWQRGRGRVVAIAGRPGTNGDWGGDLLDDASFWRERVGAVIPVLPPGLAVELVARPEGRLRVLARLRGGGGQPSEPAQAPTVARLSAEDGSASEGGVMTLTAPGIWTGEVEVEPVGSTLITVASDLGTTVIAHHRAISRELARLEPDHGMLRRISTATGGRLRSADWEGAEVDELAPPSSRRLPLAPLLLLLAAALACVPGILPQARSPDSR